MTLFTEMVYEAVKRIPRGKVASYGQIARLAGNPRGARAVGFALHRNPDTGTIPCHRVVFQNGNVASGYAFGGPAIKRQLLEQEGVFVSADGYIDMQTYGWDEK